MLVAVNRCLFPSVGWSVTVSGWLLLLLLHFTSLISSLGLTMALCRFLLTLVDSRRYLVDLVLTHGVRVPLDS
jgi:hypothetical protein